MYAVSPLPDIETIRRRLEIIFPEGLSDRQYVVRITAARIILTMLYADAVESRDVWLAPVHVYRMSEAQAKRQTDDERMEYRDGLRKKGYKSTGQPWLADNSREQVRDESLRDGLVQKNAVIVKQGIPTTSSAGRYCLRKSFADLFIVPEAEFERAVAEWWTQYLNPAELARVQIMRDRGRSEGAVTVELPNGETRLLSAGPSSPIAKAVIEDFARRFLHRPEVLWISESGNKVVARDDKLMRQIGLPIDEQRLLPDIVIADLGRENILLVFAEIVATDGPFTEARKTEILALTEQAGFSRDQVVFLSAFEHRNAAPLKKRLSGIAVDSYAWCMAEPNLLIWFGAGSPMVLTHI